MRQFFHHNNMLLVSIAITIGLYFFDCALEIDNFSQKMILSNLYHFSGGVAVFFLAHAHLNIQNVKHLFWTAMTILVGDHIIHTIAGTWNISFIDITVMLHNIVIISWGCIIGDMLRQRLSEKISLKAKIEIVD